MAKRLVHWVEWDAVPTGPFVRPKTSMKARTPGILPAGLRSVRQQGGETFAKRNRYCTKQDISYVISIHLGVRLQWCLLLNSWNVHTFIGIWKKASS